MAPRSIARRGTSPSGSARRWMSGLAIAIASLLAGCSGGGGGAAGGAGSTAPQTVSVQVRVYLNNNVTAGQTPQATAIRPMKPIGSSSDVKSVWLLVHDTTNSQADDDSALTFDSTIGAWTRTVTALPLNKALSFDAKAYKTLTRSAVPTDLVFYTQTPPVQTLNTGSELVTLNLSVNDDGTPYLFPRILSVAINPGSILPGSATTTVDVTVGSSTGVAVAGSDETFSWTLAGDATEGQLTAWTSTCTPTPVTTGNFSVPVGQSQATFRFCYQAPSAEGFFEKTVAVFNAGGDSTSTSFWLYVTLTAALQGVQVYLPPVIQNLGAARLPTNDLSLSAASVDDKPTSQLNYAWSFNPTPQTAPFSLLPTLPVIANPGVLTNYTPDVAGTIALTVTDHDGANSSVTVSLSQNQFPDAVVPLGPYAAAKVFAGGLHACAVLAGGNVSCWGYNGYGQLGNGNTTEQWRQSLVVTNVTGTLLSGVNAASPGSTVAGGYLHSCAVKTDGSVMCWGYNGYGQLGNGSTASSSVALPVTAISGAVAVAAGTYHSCALISTGAVYCWGYNYYGQLGAGLFTDSHAAVAVSGIDGSVAKASAIAAGDLFTCAVMSLPAGEVWCWGRNHAGQLGRGNALDGQISANSTPFSVLASGTQGSGVNFSGADQVAAGNDFACARLTTQEVRCWGLNSSGQLGDNTTTSPRLNPVITLQDPSTHLQGVSQVSAGDLMACAIVSGGIECWGSGANGRLGYNSTANRSLAVPVYSLATVDTFAVLGLGAGFGCAILTPGGNMRCWGYNANGRLGDGTNIDRLRPVGVDYLSLFN